MKNGNFLFKHQCAEEGLLKSVLCKMMKPKFETDFIDKLQKLLFQAEKEFFYGHYLLLSGSKGSS